MTSIIYKIIIGLLVGQSVSAHGSEGTPGTNSLVPGSALESHFQPGEFGEFVDGDSDVDVREVNGSLESKLKSYNEFENKTPHGHEQAKNSQYVNFSGDANSHSYSKGYSRSYSSSSHSPQLELGSPVASDLDGHQGGFTHGMVSQYGSGLSKFSSIQADHERLFNEHESRIQNFLSEQGHHHQLGQLDLSPQSHLPSHSPFLEDSKGRHHQFVKESKERHDRLVYEAKLRHEKTVRDMEFQKQEWFEANRQREVAHRQEVQRQREEAHRQEVQREREEAHRQEVQRQREEAHSQEVQRQREEAHRQEVQRQREEAHRQEVQRQREEAHRQEVQRQREEAYKQEKIKQEKIRKQREAEKKAKYEAWLRQQEHLAKVEAQKKAFRKQKEIEWSRTHSQVDTFIQSYAFQFDSEFKAQLESKFNEIQSGSQPGSSVPVKSILDLVHSKQIGIQNFYFLLHTIEKELFLLGHTVTWKDFSVVAEHYRNQLFGAVNIYFRQNFPHFFQDQKIMDFIYQSVYGAVSNSNEPKFTLDFDSIVKHLVGKFHMNHQTAQIQFTRILDTILSSLGVKVEIVLQYNPDQFVQPSPRQPNFDDQQALFSYIKQVISKYSKTQAEDIIKLMFKNMIEQVDSMDSQLKKSIVHVKDFQNLQSFQNYLQHDSPLFKFIQFCFPQIQHIYSIDQELFHQIQLQLPLFVNAETEVAKHSEEDIYENIMTSISGTGHKDILKNFSDFANSHGSSTSGFHFESSSLSSSGSSYSNGHFASHSSQQASESQKYSSGLSGHSSYSSQSSQSSYSHSSVSRYH